VIVFALLRIVLDESPDVGLDHLDLGEDVFAVAVQTNGSALAFQCCT